MNHLLIAGGTGFIGYHLATKLKKKGWKSVFGVLKNTTVTLIFLETLASTTILRTDDGCK